jgi:magnesium transporter
VLTCRVFRDGVLVEHGIDPTLISERLTEEGTIVWLDVRDPGPGELSLLRDEFAVHPLAIEDAERRGQRPKVEPYEGYHFVVVRAVHPHDDHVNLPELHAFVSDRYLVSLRYGDAPALEPVLYRLERHPELVREGGGGFLLYALLDEVVDGYLRIIDWLEDRTDEIEEAVFADDVPEDLQERVFRLRKQVVELRRAISPAREVVVMLQVEPTLVPPPLAAYYRDVADHVIRALDFIDNVRELLATVLDAHLSQASHRLNLVMKQLTSWAAIILVPTLIAGIYGMNFEHMPELLWRYGYAWALGLMAASAGTLYWIFKRRGWL